MYSKLGLSDHKAHGYYIFCEEKKYDVTFFFNYITTFSLKTITNNKSESYNLQSTPRINTLVYYSVSVFPVFIPSAQGQ